MYGVNIVSGGRDAVNAMLYGGNQSIERMQHLDNQIQNLKNYASSLGSKFINTVTNLYDRYNGNEYITYAKTLLSTGAVTNINNNTISYLNEETIWTMNDIMRRYIHSNPQMNELDRRGLCYGFGYKFIDREPDTFGEDRVDYQRVMDGVLQYTEEGNGVIKYYTNSFDVEEDLHYLDKFSILDTWHTVAELIANGKDPSSPDLEDL